MSSLGLGRELACLMLVTPGDANQIAQLFGTIPNTYLSYDFVCSPFAIMAKHAASALYAGVVLRRSAQCACDVDCSQFSLFSVGCDVIV